MPNDLAAPSATVPSRSTFVTVLAWIFIAGAGMVVFIAILQAIMFVFVFPPTDEILSASRMPPEFQQMPAVFRFMVENVFLFFVLFWSLAVVTLFAAIGLLYRKNWARLGFIGLMGFAILWNLGGLWLQHAMFSSFPAIPASAPPDFAAGFETAAIVMRIGSVVFAVGVSVLFAWIIKRLSSKSIRAEFHAL